MTTRSCRPLVLALAAAAALTAIGPACRNPEPGSGPGASASPTPGSTPAGDPEEAIRHLNAGIAWLEQHKFGPAQADFERALALRPDYVEAHINLAIAHSAQVKYAEAEAALARALAAEPDNPTANYMAGLIHKYKGEKEAGIAAFERVRKVDPDDVDTKFNLATLYKDAGRVAEAVPLLEQVIVEAPHFISAYYALGQMLMRQSGEGADPSALARGRELIERFQKLSGGTSGETAGLRYGEQGRYGLALEDRSALAARPKVAITLADAAEERGVRFVHGGAKASELGSGALVFDLDADGDDDIVLAGGEGGAALRLFRNRGGGQFEDATEPSGLVAVRGPAAGIAAGDIDGDGQADLLVAGRLLRATEGGRYADGTRKAGLERALADAASLGLVDLDHDGDLGLAATFPRAGGVKVWRNDATGVFSEVTRDAGFAGKQAAMSLVFADFDNDRDIDGAVGVAGGAPLLFSNNREMSFAELAAPAGLTGAGATRGISAGDIDGDGYPDLLVTHARAEGHVLYRNTRNRKFAELQTLPAPAPASSALFLDADLDGDADLLIAEATGIRLFRNDGAGGFTDDSAASGLSALVGDVRGLAAGDLDGDGDIDLVANVFAGAARVLLNRGGEGQGWIQIATRGTNSNKSGFGTKVELRSARLHHKIEIRGADGFLSQSSPVASFGLGGDTRVDRMRLLWPGGVLQAEIGMAPNKRHIVEELDRKGSSCPFLWVWDGEQMVFVSDILGGSPLGLWVAPGMRNLPDPDERFLLPEGVAKPRDGYYDIRISESLEEVAYLDRVRLQVVDTPAEVRAFPDERLLLMPPFASGKLRLLRELRPAERATSGDGQDRTAELRSIDERYAGARGRTRFRGFAEPWSLELDFGTLPVAQRGQPVVLLAHGHVEFSNSTPMYAAAQAGVHFELPSLEVLDGSGRVVATIADAGAPAGLPKWMLLDLSGKLPADGRVRLRYRTSMEVYFDQIQLALADPEAPHRASFVEAASATLHANGYPTLVARAGHPPTYRYGSRLAQETWTSQEGAYTRFGDVLALLGGEDDRLVVMSHGDEIELRFPVAGLPPLPAGWRRDLVLESVGYAKDLDPHSAAPLTVGPLPWRAMTAYPYDGPGPFGDPDRLAELGQWSTRYIRPVEGALR